MVLWLVVGGAIGAGVAWALANSRTRGLRVLVEERGREAERTRGEVAARDQELRVRSGELQEARVEAATATARLQEMERAAAEKIQSLIEVEKSLKESFEALAGKALHSNSEQLMRLARQQLDQQQGEAKQELEAKETAIRKLLEPMQESLQRLSTHSQQLEVKREGAYQVVLAEIQNIQRSHADLRKETTQLVQALRAPKVRGNWGEMQLRRCVEFAGMLEHASFEVEQFVRGDDVAIRPDMVVKLPNGRSIIVDAKTPLDAFLEASVCEDELTRTVHLKAHALRVKKHLDSLCGKSYWKQFPESPDFVVCFLPSEVLFSAALEQDPSLLEHSASSNVLLATPTTLIALLKAVAFGWQQSQIARDAEKIRDAAIKVHEKLAGMHGAILTLGDRLRKAGDAYDDMLVKAEGRGGLFSVSRKLRELKIGEKDLADGAPAALRLRPMEAEDWQPSLSLAAETEEKMQ